MKSPKDNMVDGCQPHHFPLNECVALGLRVPIRRSTRARLPSVHLKPIGELLTSQATPSPHPPRALEQVLSTNLQGTTEGTRDIDSVLIEAAEAHTHVGAGQ